ncbi:MAG: hypothetical protein J6N70_11230 [Oribacterium sp.]|nr:hypothetical protein [Oribacterium sp.]
MTKFVIALLTIAVLFCFSCGLCEESFDELSEQFHDLSNKIKRIDEIEKVYHNGLPTYPERGYEDEYAFDAYTIVPVIKDEEDGKQYAGMSFLITGTVLDAKGYGIDFELDDGRKCIVSFREYDFENSKMHRFGVNPPIGTHCNIFCTFKSFGFEMLDDHCYRFLFTASEEAKMFCEKRK